VEGFEKKLDALVEGAGGFLAPPSAEATISRVNGQANTLYQQVWQADAAPTSSQSQALAALAADNASVTKRWREFKGSDVAAMNRELRAAKLPELNLETNRHQEEIETNEE
jgi:hypothetical protein